MPIKDLPKHTYKATMPDGSILTRTTQRVYTHVVAVLSDTEWGWVQWCGRPDLAEKAAQRTRGYGCWEEVRIIPVDNPRPETDVNAS